MKKNRILSESGNKLKLRHFNKLKHSNGGGFMFTPKAELSYSFRINEAEEGLHDSLDKPSIFDYSNKKSNPQKKPSSIQSNLEFSCFPKDCSADGKEVSQDRSSSLLNRSSIKFQT